MDPTDGTATEEQLSLLLADCDEALAAGRAAPSVRAIALPAELQARLERRVALCGLARRLLAESPSGTTAAAVVDPGPVAPLPHRLGRFEVRRELGRGGFGVVFLAFDPKLGREIALKVPRPEVLVLPDLRARFQHEGRAAAGLDHPNLVPVYEAGDDGTVCYIASAYCPGITLSAWLKQQTEPVPFAVAGRLLATLAAAVAHAHQRGILHRDLKPGNVLLSPVAAATAEALAFVPRITDFGLAKVLGTGLGPADGEAHTRTGAILGTPSYMAPEQAGGDSQALGPATDVYALGGILYELLTGRPPFRGDTALETLLQVRNQEPLAPARLRSGVPRDLETICLTCLHKDPGRRYPTAQALAEDLHRYLERQPIRARRLGAVGRLVLWCRRSPALAGTIVLAVAAVTAVAGIGLHQVLEERGRYRQERDQAQANLYRALAGEARALMQAHDTGWWWKALDNIRQAAELEVADRDPRELRELAIACMGTEFPCLRLRGTGTGHEQPVSRVAIRGDGALAASASSDGTARLWSVPDGRPLAVLPGHGGAVTGVAFHPAGRWLATSSADGAVRLWDSAAAAPVAAHVFELHAGPVNALEFAPDGSLGAACQDGTIRLLSLDAATGAETGERRSRAPQAGPLTCLAFSPDGLLAAGAANKTIRLWRQATGAELDYLVLTNAANTLAFDASGNALTWSEPEIYGVRTCHFSVANEVTLHAQIHASAVRQVCHNAPGGRLLTAAADGTLRLWRWVSRGWTEVAVAHAEAGGLHAAALDRGGRWVVAGHADGRVRIWEVGEPPQRVLLRTSQMQRAAFVGGGRQLALKGVLRDLAAGPDAPGQSFFPAGIRALAVAPAGRWFAYAAEDGGLTIGDLDRQRPPLPCAGQLGTITALAASPRGQHFASASGDGTVKIWRWESGACTATLEPGLGPLHSLDWGGDAGCLAMGGARGVAVWAPAGGGRLCPKNPKSETRNPKQIRNSNDRNLMPECLCFEFRISCFGFVSDFVLRISDLLGKAGGGPCRTIPTAEQPVSAVALHGALIAFSGPAGTIEVRELAGGRTRHRLPGHGATASALAFSPDGQWLASAARGEPVRTWDLQTGLEGASLQSASAAPQGAWLAFEPTGRFLAHDGFGATVLWDLHAHTPAARFVNNGSGRAGRFSADGTALLAGLAQGSVQLCTLADMEQARAAARGAAALPAATAVTVTPRGLAVSGGHTAEIWGLAASADGRWLATASHDRTVKLWDARTCQLVRTLEGAQDMVWCVAFSPDSKYLASGSAADGSGTVTLWEVATGRALHRWRGHRQLVMGLAFHPTGRWLASSAGDGSIHLWDVEGGQPLGRLHQFDRAVYSIAFRPDGRCLAAACLDHRVAVWDVDGPPAGPQPPSRYLEGHTASFYAVSFSADGRYLATGSEQGVIILWDAQTFARIVTLTGATDQVRDLSFSRDGGLLAGAAYIGPTIVWDLDRVRRTLAELHLDW